MSAGRAFAVPAAGVTGTAPSARSSISALSGARRGHYNPRFAEKLGLSQGDEEYDARYDLDGNGVIGFSDIVIVDNAFGNNTGSA